MATNKIIPLLFDTYIRVVKSSVGSVMFRHSYAHVHGRKKDILQDGALSCAFFASSILIWFKLIKEVHATVDGTVNDLTRSGWKRITKPRIGSVLVWEEARGTDGNLHRHIGFYVGNKKAISNNGTAKAPVLHHYTFGVAKGKPKRKITAIFWHARLDT